MINLLNLLIQGHLIISYTFFLSVLLQSKADNALISFVSKYSNMLIDDHNDNLTSHLFCYFLYHGHQDWQNLNLILYF